MPSFHKSYDVHTGSMRANSADTVNIMLCASDRHPYTTFYTMLESPGKPYTTHEAL